MSDDDDFDYEKYDEAFSIEHINHELAQEIIDWAVATSGLAVFMDNMPLHVGPEEAEEKIEALLQGVRLMVVNMPEKLVPVGIEIAQQSVADAIHEEEQVEQFREELEGL